MKKSVIGGLLTLLGGAVSFVLGAYAGRELLGLQEPMFLVAGLVAFLVGGVLLHLLRNAIVKVLVTIVVAGGATGADLRVLDMVQDLPSAVMSLVQNGFEVDKDKLEKKKEELEKEKKELEKKREEERRR